jgi:hypothetical protein
MKATLGDGQPMPPPMYRARVVNAPPPRPARDGPPWHLGTNDIAHVPLGGKYTRYMYNDDPLRQPGPHTRSYTPKRWQKLHTRTHTLEIDKGQ